MRERGGRLPPALFVVAAAGAGCEGRVSCPIAGYPASPAFTR